MKLSITDIENFHIGHGPNTPNAKALGALALGVFSRKYKRIL